MAKQNLPAHPRSEGSTGRLQALSDGVFAVAMTVLALGLPYHTGHSAGDTLRAILPRPLLPVTGLSYRLQARFSRSAVPGRPD
jgi:hypothetical protein